MNKRHLILTLLSLLGLAIVAGIAIGIAIDHAQRTRGISYGFPDPTNSPAALIDNGLSVNVTLEQYDETQLAENLKQIKDAGFTWIRQSFPWSQIEATRGQFDWSKWDRIVDTAQGLHLIAVLDTSPSWASTSNFYPPTSNSDFSKFVQAFAQRYGDRIDYYQIWDEPNLRDRWNGEVNPVAYAEMLRQARAAIRQVDPTSLIILAGLAPTIETSSANMADWLYLRRLYEAGAGSLFDVASGKPYGFGSAPDDHTIDSNVLNFQHIVLMREEMVAHGDASKPIWASHFGWNVADNSIWGEVSDQQQIDYAQRAIRYARANWPWLGVMSIENWEPVAAKDDPHWGFSIKGKKLLEVLYPPGGLGFHPAAIQDRPDDAAYQPNPAAGFTGNWRFSELGADWSATGDSVSFQFTGTSLALRVRRAADRANLFITIDRLPANALPQDDRGAYLQLIPPDASTTDVRTVPIATGLSDSTHSVLIEAERGWNQWSLIGWSVGSDENRGALVVSYSLLGIGALLFLLGTIFFGRGVQWRTLSKIVSAAYSKLSSGKQVAVALFTSLFLYASAWMTWGVDLSAAYRRTGDVANIIATLAAATIFYVSPWLILTIISGLILFILIIFRLDLGLALVALFAPFFFLPKELFYSAFSMAELILIMCVIAYVLRAIVPAAKRSRSAWSGRMSPITHHAALITNYSSRLTSLDCAVASLLIVSIIATFLADYKVFAFRELRVIILEPIVYYALIRSAKLDRQAVWHIVDALILAGTLVAIIGLIQYAFHINIITAEEGTERLRSVYGSPNNVGLFLGRVFPVGLAILLLGNDQRRRILYGLALIPIAAAIVLSQSRGAIFIGLPASILAIGLLAGGKWLWRLIGALVVAGLASIPLLNSPRIQALFNAEGGTSFFRISLWKSALEMIRDHPLFGVGPDNFLYAYRDRYLRPEAWQESALSHPHNFILDFAARLGLIGLGAFVWIQISFWRTAWFVLRKSKPFDLSHWSLVIGLMASMIDFLTHGLVDAAYFVVDLAYVFMLTLALVARLRDSEMA
ncbi:MAG TPA: O-antigen ligase family protein [Anaerolineae bacterium]|nr:O-antigen ligase family protein [Anaerolineae bacterium]